MQADCKARRGNDAALLRVKVLGFRVEDLGFRVEDLGFRVLLLMLKCCEQGLNLKVYHDLSILAK